MTHSLLYKHSKIISTLIVLTGLFLYPVTTSAQSLTESIARGKGIYTSECINCHMENGEGIPGAFPPLANSDYFAEDLSKAVRAILGGLEGELVVNGQTYYGVMEAVPLTEVEVADVLNYIRNSWGGQAEGITGQEVGAMK